MKSNPLVIEHTCPWWLLFLFDNPLRRLIHDPLQILGGYVQAGGVVLDVGCGMGYFTLGLARLVGNSGRVIAADLQEGMLRGLRRRAEQAGLMERIRLLRCSRERIGVEESLDFALAFWMVHEVRQPERFLGEILAALRPGGRLLVVEPLIHVPARTFEQMVMRAERTGFQVEDRPRVRASRAVLLRKEGG